MTDTQTPPQQNFPQPADQQQPGPGVLNRTAPLAPAVPVGGGPSTVETVDNLAEVAVDQWGHRGEYVKGDILDRTAIDPSHYDWDHAVRVGALRPLTHAEARVWGAGSSSRAPLNADGTIDEDQRRTMRYQAGIPDELPRTVTTEQGPAEPAEFSKPTLPFSGDNQPAARPVVTASALEAETEGARAARAVATSSGTVWAQSEQTDSSGGQKPSAAELVAQAKAAQTGAELDAIDGQADARMTTVHDAVSARRAELAQQG